MAKVRLIGWEGVSWSMLHPLLERGALPNLQRLLTRGTGAELRRVRPLIPATQWASIATGKRATKHRMLVEGDASQALYLWEILEANGFKTHAVNWTAASNEEAGDPAMVRDLRVTPDAIDIETVNEFAGGCPAETKSSARAFLARTSSIHGVITWSLEHETPDFAAVRYDGLAKLDARLTDAALRFYDMTFARLADLAGSGTTILLVSDVGLLAVGGHCVTGAAIIRNANVCDVTPTILSLFGLPAALDMDGAAISPPLSLAPIEPRRTSEDAAFRPPTLGRPFDSERQRRLGEAWADAGEFDRAAEIFRGLVEQEPTSVTYRSALAEAYFWAGRWPECRTTIHVLQADGIDTPLGRAALAAMDHQVAFEHLQKAIELGPKTSAEWDAIGRVYVRIREYRNASAAFQNALALDPNDAAAYDGLAIAALVSGEPLAAEAHARRAIAAKPDWLDARIRLAVALSRHKRFFEAMKVLDTAGELVRTIDAIARQRLNRLRGRCRFRSHETSAPISQ